MFRGPHANRLAEVCQGAQIVAHVPQARELVAHRGELDGLSDRWSDVHDVFGAVDEPPDLVCVLGRELTKRASRRLQIARDRDLEAVARVAIGQELLHGPEPDARNDAELFVEPLKRAPREPVNAAVDRIRSPVPRGADAAEREVVLDDGRSKAARPCVATRRQAGEATTDDHNMSFAHGPLVSN